MSEPKFTGEELEVIEEMANKELIEARTWGPRTYLLESIVSKLHGAMPPNRCPDCGMEDEKIGHMGCLNPSNHHDELDNPVDPMEFER